MADSKLTDDISPQPVKPPRRPDPRPERTKALFRAGLLEIIAESGTEAAPTVTMLCDRTGLNRTTFYLHFADVSALAEDIAHSIVSDVTREWTTVNAEDPERFYRESKKYLTRYLEHLASRREFYLWAFESHGSWAIARSILDDYTMAIRAGLPTVADEQQRDLHAAIIGGALFGAVTKWIREPGLTATELTDFIWEALDDIDPASKPDLPRPVPSIIS